MLSGSQHGEAAKGIDGKDRRASVDAQRFEIAANQRGRWWMILDENDFGGAPAEGFNADGAGSGKKINEAGADYVGGQDVEESFTQAVAGGAEGEAFEALQDAAAVGSSDDAHECSY